MAQVLTRNRVCKNFNEALTRRRWIERKGGEDEIRAIIGLATGKDCEIDRRSDHIILTSDAFRAPIVAGSMRDLVTAIRKRYDRKVYMWATKDSKEDFDLREEHDQTDSTRLPR